MAPALGRALRERWERHQRELRACRRRFSAKAVHESRVAARRLLATLTLLAEVVPGTGARKACRRLKRQLSLFAPLRDAQVQAGLLPLLRLPAGVRAEFQTFLKRRERQAARAAEAGLDRLKSRKVARVVARMERALRRAEGALPAARCRALVAARFRAVRSRRDAARAGAPAAIHRTRVAFKRFRYSVELLAVALPRFSPARAIALRRHQALMGAVQDAGVTLDWFSEFARQPGLEPRFAAAIQQRLARRRDRAVARYLRHAAALDRFWSL